MTNEEKQLLLADLCARLAYYPIVSVAYNYSDKGIVWESDILRIKLLLEIEENDSWEYIKPYLRPMSSMTEEEDKEICQFMKDYNLLPGSNRTGVFCSEIVDWLNAHHFDYRGLIEKKLAIEVTEENNPYKE